MRQRAENILTVLGKNPFQNHPPYEKLVGDLCAAYSHRINIKHRIIHQIFDDLMILKVIRIWLHYE
ncbi:MAG: Txe/YoeB family addiction module toxin [Bacteroidota bacterium]